MYSTKMPIIIILFIVSAVCFEDLNALNEGEGLNEMLEQGKHQYQLLQERGKLPKYGSCWLQAIEHIEEGCRALTEETQSDIALHLTNCFLEMSGHQTYNCISDKKPNLRGICISSMSDRAFNVYTQFYTHTQNMCWFLRGQVWQETITENTMKVGKRLKESVENIEELLENQKRSIEMQERLLSYGSSLEIIFQNFLAHADEHRQLLEVMSRSIAGLQSWILGEISWIDTIIFYIVSLILVMFFTSNPRTFSARIPICILLAFNLLAERFLCKYLSKDVPSDLQETSKNYYTYIWYIRYIFVTISIITVICSAYFYKDYTTENNKLLIDLNLQIRNFTSNHHLNNQVDTLRNTPEIYLDYSTEKILKGARNFLNKNDNNFNRKSVNECIETSEATPKSKDYEGNKSNLVTSRKKLQPLLDLQNNGRYNLRSRQGTPDSTVSNKI